MLAPRDSLLMLLIPLRLDLFLLHPLALPRSLGALAREVATMQPMLAPTISEAAAGRLRVCPSLSLLALFTEEAFAEARYLERLDLPSQLQHFLPHLALALLRHVALALASTVYAATLTSTRHLPARGGGGAAGLGGRVQGIGSRENSRACRLPQVNGDPVEILKSQCPSISAEESHYVEDF